jgi:SAM-dependent methyltransferase
MIKKLLQHPLTKGLSIDNPRTTELRREIIKEKSFLSKLYVEWYELIHKSIPEGEGIILELGSGGGFLEEVVKGTVTSDVFHFPGVQAVLDARWLPFGPDELKAVVMVDVFHHIPNVSYFLCEVQRCLRKDGVVVMIEPWVSPWSSIIYSLLHHEPFEPDAEDWRLPSAGPLSGANSALPWIVFERDITIFNQQFSNLRLECITLDYPFSYFVSGGVSFRSLVPGWAFSACRFVERFLMRFLGKLLASFAFIALRKI